jgi:lysophospholipase L1-like esterase
MTAGPISPTRCTTRLPGCGKNCRTRRSSPYNLCGTPRTTPAFLVDYGKVIKKEVQAVGGEYLKIGSPLEGRPNLVQDDGVHPTDDGQKLLAAAVNESLSRS